MHIKTFIALKNAAKARQLVDGQISIDRQTLLPASPASTPPSRTATIPIPGKIENAILYGANWYRNKIWHSTNEDPDEGKDLLLTAKTSKGDTAYYIGLFDSSSRKVLVTVRTGFPWLPISHFERWAYLDDLLPTEGFKETQ